VERYYTGRFAEHGASARGVDWNSAESQELRLRQVLKVCDARRRFTLNDYGCGYGALVPILECLGMDADYCGFDLSEPMLGYARRTYERAPRVTFVDRQDLLAVADYTVASGVFNVRLDVTIADWERYVHSTIGVLARLSSVGFAFNMLTSYADTDKMRPDLYYGDPRVYFDICKRYARNVALLHDYDLYEFTMIVRCDE
jgi:hypothetical protein